MRCAENSCENRAAEDDFFCSEHTLEANYLRERERRLRKMTPFQQFFWKMFHS
jgi:hypothetical protein